jgi:hypothetical protein
MGYGNGKGNKKAQKAAKKGRIRDAKRGYSLEDAPDGSGEIRVPVAVQQPQQQGQGKQNQQQQQNSKKSSANAVEEFYQFILSWPLGGLVDDNRNTLGLPLLTEMPSCFDNNAHYFDTMVDTVVEEARATISQSLKQYNQSSMELAFKTCHKPALNSSLVLIEFSIIRGENEFTRPGWTFQLKPNDRSNYSNYNSSGVTAESASYSSTPANTLAAVAQGPVSSEYTLQVFITAL